MVLPLLRYGTAASVTWILTSATWYCLFCDVARSMVHGKAMKRRYLHHRRSQDTQKTYLAYLLPLTVSIGADALHVLHVLLHCVHRHC